MDINIRYFNTDNTILSELFRLEQFQKILLEVKTIYACKFNTTLDSFKNKKINTFISLWIMNQFDNIDITEIIPDPIFPYNGYKNKQLAINLINTNLVKTEEEAYELIQDWDLSQKMTQACVATSKFIQSDEFQVLQHDYKIQTYEEYISVSSQRENTQRESHFKKFKIIIGKNNYLEKQKQIND